jgi:proteic killer suppression protein
MIKSWRHKGLRKFYETGDKSGIQPKHVKAIQLLLFQLANARQAEDMNTPGNDYHTLRGNKKGFHSVKVNANWRIIYEFKDGHATNVDYLDYH